MATIVSGFFFGVGLGAATAVFMILTGILMFITKFYIRKIMEKKK